MDIPRHIDKPEKKMEKNQARWRDFEFNRILCKKFYTLCEK